ncbi:uncharacterized protein LOC131425970 [Malaya genurostris]|uniref:uncharacterized protein LOC131425970 n=1 Tax=Malaya genurostris TaxID=325434 RepID=UPI0026F3DB7D|nr:uncharacterized protein LOC131425970 [Malaya genurostris]
MKCFALILTLLLPLLGLVFTGAAETVEDCTEISCRTFQHINTLWCHTRPTYFCQCRPSPTGLWVAQVMPCAIGTVFSFRQQVCVHPSDTAKDDDCTDRILTELDELCEDPPVRCGTPQEINRLACHKEPKKFCQCRPLDINPTLYAPLARPCAPETTFSFRQQTCVHDWTWTDSCSEDGGDSMS